MSGEKNEAPSVWLREYRVGDEQGIIDCIRDEYGNSYVKAQWYSKTAIWENAVTGRCIFIVAQLPNREIAATTALAKTQRKNASVYEIAAQVVKKKYRGHGIAQRIFEYSLKLLEDKNVSAVFSQPVLFHDITQRLLCGLGFHAVGIVPNIFDLEVLHHSYDNGRNAKMPLGIQARAAGRQTAGRLYLPKQHRDFIVRRYEELCAEYEIADGSAGDCKKLPESSISYQYNRTHQHLEITIFAVGIDWERQLKQLLRTYPLRGKNTANVFLSMNDANAVCVYHWLSRRGFFFTGLMPLCSDKEYMIMHHMGETPFYFEDLKLNREFETIANYIEKEKSI